MVQDLLNDKEREPVCFDVPDAYAAVQEVVLCVNPKIPVLSFNKDTSAKLIISYSTKLSLVGYSPIVIQNNFSCMFCIWRIHHSCY